jgi:hypothetical protein
LLHRTSLLFFVFALACGAESSARPAPHGGRRAISPRGGTWPAASERAPSTHRAGALTPPFPTPGATPPALPLAEIGDPVPLTVERVGHTGRWLAACTARADSDKNGRIAVDVGAAGTFTGDALGTELVVGGRKPESIEDLFAYDPTGRFVAFRRGGRALLADLSTGTELDLATLDWDDRDDALPLRAHRALAFDPRGEILAYVRRRAGRSEVVLRALATGTEQGVTELPGEPHRMAWDGIGEQLVVWTVADDTNGNGRPDWPAPAAKGPRFGCSGPLPRLRATPEVGDRASTFVVPRAGGPARYYPDFASPFGSGVVVRSPDGELLLTSGAGRKTLAPASCGAKILASDPTRGLLVVACPGKNPQKAGVELVGVGYRLELGVEVQPTSIDAWPDRPTRLVALYPGLDALLVDLERRATVRLEPGDQVIATSGARALVRRKNGILLFDIEKNTTKVLVPKLPPLPFILVQGTVAAVGSEVVDVLRDDPLGSISGRPLALTPSGDVLVARGGPPSAERLALGPLMWERPAPPAAANAGSGARMLR